MRETQAMRGTQTTDGTHTTGGTETTGEAQTNGETQPPRRTSGRAAGPAEGAEPFGADGASSGLTRPHRLARLVAKVLGVSGGLVDPGGSERPVVTAALGHCADRLAAAWRRPDVRSAATLTASGEGEALFARFFALPIMLGGREAWLAGIDAPDRATPPELAALTELIAELSADRAGQMEAAALWLSHLERDNRQMARAERVTGIGTLTYDVRSGAIDISPSGLRVLGREAVGSLEEFLGVFDPFDRHRLYRLFAYGDARQAAFDVERPFLDDAGKVRHVHIHGEHVWGEDRWGGDGGRPATLFATLHDVTVERARTIEMRELAECDQLTGVKNRNVLETAAAAAVDAAAQSHTRVGLFIVDIDAFKEINDIHGHPAGDEVLRFVARGLTSLVRASDVVLRLSGNEFAVILHDAGSAESVMALVRRIHDILCCHVRVAGQTVALSLSIGVAVFPDDTSVPVDLYRAADYALTEAKSAASGTILRFDPAMRERRARHRMFIAEARQGLARGEFMPFFQPKLDLSSRRVVGFEALCRWRHPERGVLGPGDFLAALEDPDLAGTLSDVSLAGAFAAVAAFHRRGIPVGHIAVNLNCAQLERVDLLPQVQRLQREYGVERHEIVFEILENVLIREKRTTYENLTDLYARGFHLSLDDFGTGFASLSHIREPFIREVKIDRSFVASTTHNRHDREIVASIVGMAHKMGLKVVAEGIEDEATLKQLVEIGCTVGQGFIFAPALPLHEAQEFVSRQNRIAAMLVGSDTA
ncbi:putative bifunctional diguanylate cyclase/phosphodiesterase [Acuticoccus mangrovi]|uniref:Bifunctional diguanylate cyclase/phosphodiesterase n=1 Tax=Acuticoccus mangrovi TaxID=2796142 RepID=A0A934MCM3_9HYPH|nr:bifunctional diguanylate cyclase/phosphodiesterase [Acuticoccus mangrovi]MBJ3775422.1 bifunctional diguanylate cyclase/phosphodiesterase [Acuticoccus mangrovi]